MAAKCKSELLEITQREFVKLKELIDSVEPATALKKDAKAISIKDVVAHRAHWIELFLGWYSDGQVGKTVHFPAKGYKWNDLKRYNSELRKQQSKMNWTNASDALLHSYGNLLHFISGKSDSELYGQPMKGANNHWTAGRWAEAAGPSHFRSASKYLRSMIKMTK